MLPCWRASKVALNSFAFVSKSLFVKQTLIDYYTHLYKKIPPALNSGSKKAGDFFSV
jgi:hypothetical protein